MTISLSILFALIAGALLFMTGASIGYVVLGCLTAGLCTLFVGLLLFLRRAERIPMP